MPDTTTLVRVTDLPGLDCGLCGFRSCEEMAARLEAQPELIQRCIHLSENRASPATVAPPVMPRTVPVQAPADAACVTCANVRVAPPIHPDRMWRDTLDREFDFYLEHFPEEPGPRDIILPHNPMLTRELDIQRGDILIGRPLGMSCGCPITHCGVVMDVDARIGLRYFFQPRMCMLQWRHSGLVN